MMNTGAGRMRAPDWSHEETLLLAKLRRDAVFSRTIEGVWTRIGNTIFNSFGHTRSDDQCKRRWETLQKVYKAIQRYCGERGREHWQLDSGDWESVKLATAYRDDWYVVVKEVCEEEQHRKQRKRRRPYPEPTQPRQSEYSDQAVTVQAPNSHEDPQSSGTTVDAQSSTSLMPSPPTENLSPSQAKIERLKMTIQTLRLQLQVAEQELRQITQGDQEVLRNSSSPGTSQSSQVVEHEEPQIQGMAAPQKINVKHNIVTPNPAGDDAMTSFFMEPFNVFEKAVKTPLPTLTADDTWALTWPIRIPSLGLPHHSGASGIKDFMSNGNPGAFSFDAVFEPHTNVVIGSSIGQQECQIMLEINTRIMIKATQNLHLSVSNQATKTGLTQQGRSPPSLDLRLSTGTAIPDAEEHQKLIAELRTLKQQLQDVIQQISEVTPNGSELSVPCEASNSAITPSQPCLGKKDTATKEQIKLNNNNTGIDLNSLPTLPDNEVPGGNEPGYYIVAADDIEPTPDCGLTECLARMSLSPSPTTLKPDTGSSTKVKDSPKSAGNTTADIPTANSGDSLRMEDDYPQGNLCLTMDQSWLASAPPSSVCDELLGRSVTNMGIFKSSMNSQPCKSHVKELTPSRRWSNVLELLMRLVLHLKRSALPLSNFRENHLIADGNLGHDLQKTQPAIHSGESWECTDLNY